MPDDAAAVAGEQAVLAEIIATRKGAEHFRMVSVMGKGEFGYVFKVNCAADVDWAAVRGVVCSRDERHVCCRCAAPTRATRTRTSTTR